MHTTKADQITDSIQHLTPESTGGGSISLGTAWICTAAGGNDPGATARVRRRQTPASAQSGAEQRPPGHLGTATRLAG